MQDAGIVLAGSATTEDPDPTKSTTLPVARFSSPLIAKRPAPEGSGSLVVWKVTTLGPA
jgi:hypothetical protein